MGEWWGNTNEQNKEDFDIVEFRLNSFLIQHLEGLTQTDNEKWKSR